MQRFTINGTGSAVATKSLITLQFWTAIQKVRPVLYDVVLGSSSIPQDNAVNIHLQRLTAFGAAAGAYLAPVPLLPYGTTSRFNGNLEQLTAEPTYSATGVLLSVSLNQQATFRWVVPTSEGMVIPNTNEAGIGIRFNVVSGGSSTWVASMFWEED